MRYASLSFLRSRFQIGCGQPFLRARHFWGFMCTWSDRLKRACGRSMNTLSGASFRSIPGPGTPWRKPMRKFAVAALVTAPLFFASCETKKPAPNFYFFPAPTVCIDVPEYTLAERQQLANELEAHVPEGSMIDRYIADAIVTRQQAREQCSTSQPR